MDTMKPTDTTTVAARDARRCACPVWDARDCLTLRYQLPRNYYQELGIDEVCECACHTSDENPYYQPYDDDDD